MPDAHYVDVILPLAFGGILTYSLPEGTAQENFTGRRVIVPVGKRKLYTGIIVRSHNTKPAGYSIKEIITFSDDKAVVNDKLISLWLWTADYYICAAGEVLKAAMPSVLLPGSETVIRTGELWNESLTKGDISAQLLFDVLKSKKEIRLSSLPETIGGRNSIKVVNELLGLGLLSSGEVVRERRKPGMITLVSLTEKLRGMLPEELSVMAGRAPRQKEALLYIANGEWQRLSPDSSGQISLEKLISGASISRAVIYSLEKKGLVTLSRVPEPQKPVTDTQVSLPLLSEPQQQALDSLSSQMETQRVSLLHGVTSSGKTEVYFHLIDRELKAGRQVLYLVPEIALTEQLTARVASRFGDVYTAYHSRLNDGEKLGVWRRLTGQKAERPGLIVGVRSSLFLPFEDLGLIIVDEEHDISYKQYDPAPRYNARDLSIIAAQKHNGKVLLGSATPSVETYYNAVTGKYGFARLLNRYGDVQLPEMILADTRKSTLKKKMVSHFAPELIKSIDETLSAGEQIMLLRNRRGFAAWVECRKCGTIPECLSCSVKLTYHRFRKTVVCHYCGYNTPLPANCSNCHSTELSTRGFGTEKIEDELRILFPDAAIERMDRDTTSGRDGFTRILQRFASGSTDILVGTQMIAKGHDFPGLTLIGVLNADATLNYPDFRSYERCFQLIEQVSGRAGRREKRGRVIIQTTDVDNQLLQTVKQHNYEAMYNSQLSERKLFRYPPFTRIVQIEVRHRDRDVAEKASARAASILRSYFGQRVLGPEYNPVERVRHYYARSLIVKLEKDKSLVKARDYIRRTSERLLQSEGFSGLRVVIDVDPQ